MAGQTTSGREDPILGSPTTGVQTASSSKPCLAFPVAARLMSFRLAGFTTVKFGNQALECTFGGRNDNATRATLYGRCSLGIRCLSTKLVDKKGGRRLVGGVGRLL